VLALLAILGRLNSLPAALFSYDTAQPWSTFVGRTALGLLGPVVFTLVLLGLGLGLDALRRRVGLPMLPGGSPNSPRITMLIAGLGLGGIIYATTALKALMPAGGMPDTPSTALDQAVPLLAGVPEIPQTAILAVAMFGIPILVVVGLTPRWSWRALLAGVVVTLVGTIAWAAGSAGDAGTGQQLLSVAGIGVMLFGIIVWGALCAWSWIVAALSYQALGGLRNTVYGPEWQARGAGVLTVLVATALIALIVRHPLERSS
jgi:hypothetical protein